MKTLYLSILLFASLFVHAGAGQSQDQLEVFERDGNIYLMSNGKEVQLTTSNKDSRAVLSPDGRQVVFVRQVQALKDNPWGDMEDDAALMYTDWSPDEIWTLDIKDKEAKILRKSTYERDAKKCAGWFRGLKFSTDGKTIYYVCQPCCPTTWAVHAMRSDGTGDRWVSWGEKVDVVVGGDKADQYYGYLVVERKATDGAYGISVLMTPDGKEIEK